MKRFLMPATSVFALTAILSSFSCSTTNDVKSAKKAEPKNAVEIVDDMKIGWNLGNTLDAFTDENIGVKSETCWGQPVTTKEMFASLKKAGFNTVRIPITWHNHLIDSDLTIDPEWMARSKEVVDMALSQGLYVIINVHHDTAPTADFEEGRGYYPSESAKEKSLRFVTRMWEQIATTFNNGYDYHLIFELLNEPRLVGHEREWWYDPNSEDCVASQKVLLELEQACLDKIRATGGENKERYIMLPGYVAQPWAAMADTFTLPSDKAKEKLIISVHMYDPWTFAGENPGEKVFTDEMRAGQRSTFEALNANFVQKGVGVVIGECGATNKDNLSEREAWYSHYFEQSKKNGLTAVIWDNGSVEIGEDGNVSEHYGFFNRTSGEFFFPTLLKTALEAVERGEIARDEAKAK